MGRVELSHLDRRGSMDDEKVIQAKNPAEFAEEYIVRSIWNNRFPPGTILPAERELSELIGVTRTTLREVLQRLKQDGWITIQHGKPTRVNNFWETSGLNILMTLARLDQDGMPDLVRHLLSARTNISAIYMRAAIKAAPDKILAGLETALNTADDGEAFANADYELHQLMARESGNPIYVLILNGFRNLSMRIGGHHFSYPDSREAAREFYRNLKEITLAKRHNDAVVAVREYGRQSGLLWQNHQQEIPSDLVEK